MNDDKKIIRFPSVEKDGFFPLGARIRAIRFYGPAIKPSEDGPLVSPCSTFRFEIPATEEQAAKLIEQLINRGGVMTKIGDEYFFIPWPCAAVYFELAEN